MVERSESLDDAEHGSMLEKARRFEPNVAGLNQLLAELGEPPLEEQDYRPVRAV